MTKKKTLGNHDFIPIGLYKLGGTGRFIDIEDLFIWCFNASPERFRWRKYEYPQYKILHTALVDFERRHPDLLLKTRDGLSRQLTAEGVEWIEKRLTAFSIMLGSPEGTTSTRRPNQRILNELSANPLFKEYQSGSRSDLNKYEISDLLMCSPDSPTALWMERLETYRSAAAASNRRDLVEFLSYLGEVHPEWFGDR